MSLYDDIIQDLTNAIKTRDKAKLPVLRGLKAAIKNGSKEKLPVPSAAVMDKVFEIMRAILHIEEDKGEMEFSLGLRSGEVDVMVKVAREGEKQSLKIKFPPQ